MCATFNWSKERNLCKEKKNIKLSHFHHHLSSPSSWWWSYSLILLVSFSLLLLIIHSTTTGTFIPGRFIHWSFDRLRRGSANFVFIFFFGPVRLTWEIFFIKKKKKIMIASDDDGIFFFAFSWWSSMMMMMMMKTCQIQTRAPPIHHYLITDKIMFLNVEK